MLQFLLKYKLIMRENTPPASPFHDEDDELVYVGDNIDDVIEQLEQIPNDDAIEEEGNIILTV